jgi:hypothetical protein
MAGIVSPDTPGAGITNQTPALLSGPLAGLLFLWARRQCQQSAQRLIGSMAVWFEQRAGLGFFAHGWMLARGELVVTVVG